MFLSAAEAARHVIEQQGSFSFYIGAGVSAEANPPIPIASQISEDLRSRMLSTRDWRSVGQGGSDAAWEATVEERLQWSREEERYFNAIKAVLPNQDSRVRYFKEKAGASRPAFCHHGIALLMRHGYLKATALTTNFDKLLESAFVLQSELECQVIRTQEEAKYWGEEASGKYYIVKLHGDYDTYNIVNTADETIVIGKELCAIAERLAARSGLIVLGSAGYEQSIRRLFEDFEGAHDAALCLSSGLLWGVYMGERQPAGDLPREELERKLRRRLEDGAVSPAIQRLIERRHRDNPLFAFFPVWNSGEFVLELVYRTNSKSLIGQAELYLDRPIRLSRVFSRKGLSEHAVEGHLERLRERETRQRDAFPSVAPRTALRAVHGDTGRRVSLLYGNITSRTFMRKQEFSDKRRAVVSPEDTTLSAGGGVALGLLKKAGESRLLNEIAKFAPIPQGTVAVTSGGNLPVHYLIHAAAVEVTEDAGQVSYSATVESIGDTTAALLEKAAALGVGALWVPLLGAGTAGVNAEHSLEGILRAVAAAPADFAVDHIMIFAFQESELSRERALACFKANLSDEFETQLLR